MTTNESQENIVMLSDIREEKLRALSPYGPVKAGLTTLPKTKEGATLTELLNSLENIAETLQYKSFTVYDTLVVAIERARAAHSAFTNDTTGTEKICANCGNDLPVEGENECLECLEGML